MPMSWTGSRRVAKKIGNRLGNIGVGNLLFYAALIIATLTVILGLYKGQFGDEDEKIAAAIYAAQGSSLYGGQLLNHGPLPFLLAGLGYRIHGVVGSLTALRLLPATLAILSTFLIGKTPLIRSPLLRGYAALSWSVFLSFFWTVKTMQMAIYHGLGGLMASVFVIGVLLPLERGDRRYLRLSLGACIIGAYLVLASLTFLPFVISVLASILLIFLLEKSSRDLHCSHALEINEGRVYKRVTSYFLWLGILGLVVFALLAITGVVSLQGIFYGHIYFNQAIFSRLASPLNLSFILFRQQDPAATNALRLILFAGIVIVPTWFQFLPSRTIRRPLLHALAVLPASFGMVFQSYRAGLGSITSFYALPYLLPATALLLVGSLAIFEQYQSLWVYGWKRPLRFLLVSTPLAVLITFGVYRGTDPEFSPATVYLFSKVNHVLVDRPLARQPYEDEMVADLIALIEARTPAKKVKLFAWPFHPIFFALHDRASAYPVNWFLWYNELVERDKKLSRYHACDPSLGFSESPDILYYAEWIVNGQNSAKYGKCLTQIMDERYVRVSDKIYLRKDHEVLLRALYAENPHYENLSAILTPVNIKNDLPLPIHADPLVLKTNHATQYKIVAQRDDKFDVLGLTLPVFNKTYSGEVYVCVNSVSPNQSACSQKVDMSVVRDVEMTRFIFREPLTVKSGTSFDLSLVSVNPSGHAAKGNISVLVVPSLKAPLVFTGRQKHSTSETIDALTTMERSSQEPLIPRATIP